jgi:hypothetical protein
VAADLVSASDDGADDLEPLDEEATEA